MSLDETTPGKREIGSCWGWSDDKVSEEGVL